MILTFLAVVLSDKKGVKLTNAEAEAKAKSKAKETEWLKGRGYWSLVEKAAKSADGPNKLGKPLGAAGSGGASSSSSGAASGSKPKKLGKKVELRCTNISLEVARSRLPTAKGCLIQDYPSKKRFQVHYSMTEVGQTSRTYSHNSGIWTEGQCLLSCVKWAWNRHHELTGEQCPFKISDEMCPV